MKDEELKLESPVSDGDLKTVDRTKIIHYRQLYLDRPDPITFMFVTVDTSGRIYDYVNVLETDAFKCVWHQSSIYTLLSPLPSVLWKTKN